MDENFFFFSDGEEHVPDWRQAPSTNETIEFASHRLLNRMPFEMIDRPAIAPPGGEHLCLFPWMETVAHLTL